MKYLFGPVNSRRFGVSLGVDLVPYKTCTLNCVYCECGATTRVTSAIVEYVPTGEVLAELDAYLSASPKLDVVTFSGAGEPTLHAGIGRVIAHIREHYPGYRIVVLTNGTLLWIPEVRQSLLPADIVVPSLDAVSPDIFNTIGRPAGDITPARVIEGLAAFRREFRGRLLLEIFIVPGVNDTKDELAKLKEACLKIRPDRIQINSLDRPGSEGWVRQAGREELAAIQNFFKPLAADIISVTAPRSFAGGHVGDLAKSVILILRRRPSTVHDLLTALGSDPDELHATLASMVDAGMVTVEKLERGDFYRIV